MQNMKRYKGKNSEWHQNNIAFSEKLGSKYILFLYGGWKMTFSFQSRLMSNHMYIDKIDTFLTKWFLVRSSNFLAFNTSINITIFTQIMILRCKRDVSLGMHYDSTPIPGLV